MWIVHAINLNLKFLVRGFSFRSWSFWATSFGMFALLIPRCHSIMVVDNHLFYGIIEV